MNVLMAVNNPGSNDVRVVKEAEQVVAHGGECVVVGIAKGDHSVEELINGVVYIRVALKYTLFALFLGFFPKTVRLSFSLWQGSRGKKKVGIRPIRERLSLSAAAEGRKHGERVQNSLHGDVSDDSGEYEVETSKFSVAYLESIFKWGFECIKGVSRRLRGGLVRCIFSNKRLHPISIRFRQGAYLKAFYPVLKEIDSDVIQAHELWTLESCALAADGRPMVYDSHELELHRNIPWPTTSKRVIASYESKYINRARSVIAVSNGCANAIKSYYDLDDVLVIKNVPLLSMQKHSTAHLRDDLGLGESTPLVVYTGSVTINRGLEVVLAALQMMPGYHFACVGPVNEAVASSLLDEAGKLEVSDRFHLVDAVAPSVLISYISSADVAVVPIQNVCLSYYYCMPNKLFEALHAGLPILATDLPDMRALVESEEVGVVDEMDDPKVVAAALSSLYMARATYYSEEKLERIKMEYSFENEMMLMVDAYKKIISVCEANVVVPG